MSESKQTNVSNPMGSLPIATLIRKFSVPSIISMLVGSLYNIVDQFFIGRNVGELGNAATSIAFPLSTACLAIALLFGIGGASAFGIALGENKKDDAAGYMGNSALISFICGIILMILSELFLRPMLLFFGSSESILPYAMEYTRITALGFPMLITSITCGHLIRADGRPGISMICNLTGAIINTILDAIFVSVLGMGMTGAAVATIIGQYISAFLAIYYMTKTRTVHLRRANFVPRKDYMLRPISLGAAPSLNQLAILVVQVVFNNSLRYYGTRSVYGPDTPIAVVGIVSKVNAVFMSFVIGMSQGLQPIASFNFGARKYGRVRESYIKTMTVGAIMAVAAWAVFQIFPLEIIRTFIRFETNTPEEIEIANRFYGFAVNFLRVFLFFTLLNFIQPITSNFFTAIGKAKVGTFLSLTRQIIFLLPLVILFPLFMGLDGIMYAAPVADLAAALVSAVLVIRQLIALKDA
ncbi:MATE family efflux transporter [Butyrivibrio sp. MC2013]|uniref:MATE family efflux transporter n=1 Tax=Butyrivibrio sp. MC2013 TaxID=1280686 RepID=UPI00040D8625|nr:MATE family efflux transporter [Butyrivibrio sp. MC2013]